MSPTSAWWIFTYIIYHADVGDISRKVEVIDADHQNGTFREIENVNKR